MAASTLFARGGHVATLLEEGEDYVPGQEVLEMPTSALEAVKKLAAKAEEKAKNAREQASIRGLAPPKKPVSPKEETQSTAARKRTRNEGEGEGSGTGTGKKRKEGLGEATIADLMGLDADTDAADMTGQLTLMD
jgi:hypothetical protein